MWSIIITVFIIYLATRFVFGFVIPVVVASNKKKKKMSEMHGFNQHVSFHEQQNQEAPPRNQKPSKSDYIDYEEIK